MKHGLVFVCIGMVCMTVVFFSGCLGQNPEKPPGQNLTPPGVSTGTIAERAVVDANTRFALKLYSKLCNDPQYANTTLFFSPFSISSALGITYEGARGTLRMKFSLYSFSRTTVTSEDRGLSSSTLISTRGIRGTS